MSRRTTGTLKGIGIGLLLCAAAMEGYKVYTMMHDPKTRRRRCRLKKDTGRALHVMGDVLEDMCAFAKK